MRYPSSKRKLMIKSVSDNAVDFAVRLSHLIATVCKHYNPDYDVNALLDNESSKRYIKPYATWIDETKPTVDSIRQSYMYKLVSDEYFLNLKSIYFGTAGCGKSLMKDFNSSEAEIDARMVDAMTASLTFTGYLALALHSRAKDYHAYAGVLRQLWLFAEQNCDSWLCINASTTLYYWTNSWLFKFLMAVCAPAVLKSYEKEYYLHTTAIDVIYFLYEFYLLAFAISFNFPEEAVYLNNIGTYFVSSATNDFMHLRFTQSCMHFLAATLRKIDDKPVRYKSADDWCFKYHKSFTMGTLFDFVNMPSLCKKLPKLYTKFSKKIDVVSAEYALCVFDYSDVDIHKLLSGKQSDTHALDKTVLSIFDEHFKEIHYTEDDEFFIKNWKTWLYENVTDEKVKCSLTRYENRASVLKLLANYSAVINIQAWISLVTMRDSVGLSNSNSYLWGCDVRKSRFTTEEQSAKKALSKANSDIQRLTKSNSHLQERLTAEKEKSEQLSKQVSDYKLQLSKIRSSSELEKTVVDLEQSLSKERTQNISLRNRISTLESQKSREQILESNLSDTQQRLNDAMHLTELLMNAPEDDNVELTDEELNILHKLKVHLIVPTMDSTRDLQRIMPKSSFTFTTSDSHYRMRIQRGCDIFFICLKFCTHGEYWQWKDLLKNAQDRCVALYSVGKNNIARAIIDKYNELHAKGKM